MRRTAALVVSLLLMGTLMSACSDPEPDDSGEQGMTQQLLTDVERRVDDLAAVVVVQGGEKLAERYYSRSDADDYWDSGSVTKAVLATLVGIAVDEGLIDDVDDDLGTLLPSHRDQMAPAVAATTLRDLLTMTAGFEDDPSQLLADLAARDPLGRILRRTAGAGARKFLYSEDGAHVVAHVLKEVTGLSVVEYARARLLEPLGVNTVPALESRALGPEFSDAQLNRYRAAGFAWPVDAASVHFGAGMLKLRPLDFARLGQVYLDDGMWQGRRLVPRGWVRDATTTQVEADDVFSGYGYGWWTTHLDSHRALAATGRDGPMVMVVPDLDLVVVLVTRTTFDGGPGTPAEDLASVVEDVVLPAVDDR